MNAAVVNRFESPPSYAEFDDPVAGDDEVVLAVRAAAVSPLVKSRASGRHYSSRAVFPFVPGVDGVGRDAGGRRMYFAFPRPPFGSLAEHVPVRREFCVGVPDGVDDATAAAVANPGMSSWAALTKRAGFVAGESVLVNGATGVAGRLAVQIAKHLGAKTILATGRNRAALELLPALGADVVIPLDGQRDDALVETFRNRLREHDVRVIVDYLWGAPAEHLMTAIAGGGSSASEPRIRFVQVGGSAGAALALNGGVLRSSGLELLGSGLGSISYTEAVHVVGDLLEAVVPAQLRVAVEQRPLREVKSAWDASFGERRLVLAI